MFREVNRIVNDAGIKCKREIKKGTLSPAHRAGRLQWCKNHRHLTAGWWQKNIHLFVDAKTFTKDKVKKDSELKAQGRVKRTLMMQ